MGASSVPSNHGRYVFRDYLDGLPFVNAPDFVAAINEVVRERNVDFIFPAHDSVVLKLAQHETQLACPMIGSPVATCEVCRSKSATYTTFRDIVPTPKVFGREEADMPFPVFLKPDVGQGTKGVYVAESRKELDRYVDKYPSILILEYLPGEEFTVDCLTDRHRALRFVGARRRVRTQNGISMDTHPVQDAEFDHLARTINETLLFRGAWFFQVKRNARGILTLMEIAPRISGGMGLFRNMGINFPLLSIFDALDQEIDILCNEYSIEMDRALVSRFRLDLEYDHVYIDLDDTLLLGSQVNPLAVAFIYQCRNRGVQVHLVTRHAGDIRNTLRESALEGLFDSITSLDRLTRKSECIESQKAIFIDDSFAERKRVHEAMGIPTFGVDAIESLLDWRT